MMYITPFSSIHTDHIPVLSHPQEVQLIEKNYAGKITRSLDYYTLGNQIIGTADEEAKLDALYEQARRQQLEIEG